MLDKIKQYAGYIISGLIALLTLSFLWERSKRKEAEVDASNANFDKTQSANAQKVSDLEEQKKAIKDDVAKTKATEVTDAELIKTLKDI